MLTCEMLIHLYLLHSITLLLLFIIYYLTNMYFTYLYTYILKYLINYL